MQEERISSEKDIQEGDLASTDEKANILVRLLLAHETWFDVYRDYEYKNRTFPGYAEFHSHGEKYILVKRAKLWEANTHEYIFFETQSNVNQAFIAEEIEFMISEAIEKVEPGENHMNSFISLVIVADSVEADAVKTIKKKSFHKEFKLGFHGWVDLRLAVIDLSKQEIYTNAAGKEMRASLEANAGFTCSKKRFLGR